MHARLILIGGGEHARVVAEAVESSANAELLGFVDPEPCADTVQRLGLRRLGGDSALSQFAGVLGVIGFAALGTRQLRRSVVERLTPHLAGWATVIHRTAWVSPTAVVRPGAVIMAGAVVQGGASIGEHCVINSGAVVEHDVEVGDFAQLAPGVIVGGGARLGPDSYLGLGARVRDHVLVGLDAVVGMGAVVMEDVPPGKRVMGVPAR